MMMRNLKSKGFWKFQHRHQKPYMGERIQAKWKAQPQGLNEVSFGSGQTPQESGQGYYES